MTYQGARARSQENESKRVFSISGIKTDDAGQIASVLWTEIDEKSNHDIGDAVMVPVADVIDALHDGATVLARFSGVPAKMPPRLFEVVMLHTQKETIVLADHADAASSGKWLDDLLLP